MSEVNAYYQMQIFNGDLKLKKTSRTKRARSFVRAFIQILFTSITGVSYTSFNTSNTQKATHTLNKVGIYGLDLRDYSTGVILSDKYGIVIGTSNQAVQITDYALISQITHGNSTGEMEHWGCWINPPIITTSGTQEGYFEVERIFKNNSGSSITIEEIGLYMQGHFCILRDLVGSGGQTVDDGEWLKVKYTIKITV